MKVKALQFTKKSLISRKWVFLMEEGQFHGKFFGCEIVNYVCPYKYSEKFWGATCFWNTLYMFQCFFE